MPSRSTRTLTGLALLASIATPATAVMLAGYATNDCSVTDGYTTVPQNTDCSPFPVGSSPVRAVKAYGACNTKCSIATFSDSSCTTQVTSNVNVCDPAEVCNGEPDGNGPIVAYSTLNC